MQVNDEREAPAALINVTIESQKAKPYLLVVLRLFLNCKTTYVRIQKTKKLRTDNLNV
jgi:hypothetical protein